MAWCCILLCAVASLVSLLVKALILIRTQQPELFCHTEDYQDSPPWPRRRKTFPSPALLLIPGTMVQLGHLCHAPKPNNWSLVPGVPLVSFSLSSPYCHGLFLYMARGKELYLPIIYSSIGVLLYWHWIPFVSTNTSFVNTVFRKAKPSGPLHFILLW